MAGNESMSSDDEYFDAINWEEKLAQKDFKIQKLKKVIKDMKKKIKVKEGKNEKNFERSGSHYRQLLKSKENDIMDLNRKLRKNEQTTKNMVRSERFLRDGYASMKRKKNWLEETQAKEKHKKEKIDKQKRADEEIKRKVRVEEEERHRVIEELRLKKLNKPLFSN